jgi:hypothetical protein
LVVLGDGDDPVVFWSVLVIGACNDEIQHGGVPFCFGLFWSVLNEKRKTEEILPCEQHKKSPYLQVLPRPERSAAWGVATPRTLEDTG